MIKLSKGTGVHILRGTGRMEVKKEQRKIYHNLTVEMDFRIFKFLKIGPMK